MNIYKNIAPIILLLISLMTFSCQKDETSNASNNTDNTIMFQVEDIVFPDEVTISNKSNISTKTLNNKVVKDYGNFIMELSMDEANQSSTISNTSNTNRETIDQKAKIVKKATTTQMATGVKYMLLIYKKENGIETFFKSHEVTVSTANFSLTFPKNSGNYVYYAYSYNKNTALPLPTNLNDPEIPSRTDAPLLIATGNFTLSNSTDQRVKIVFKHQVSKLEMRIDGQQLFANSFHLLDIDFNNLVLRSQNFSIKRQKRTGSIVSSVTINNQKASFSDYKRPTDGVIIPGIQVSNNELYTADLNPSINITVNGVTIIKTNTRKAILPSVENPNPISSNFSGFADNLKLSKRALIMLRYKGGPIYPNEWAEGNLYYDPTDPSNPYKFADPVFQSQAEACNYYWNFNTLLPRSITGASISPSGDPCQEVLPKGSWRTPSLQDFSTLNVANSAVGYVYFDADNGERVYFNEAGWIRQNSDCKVNNTNDGQYWSSQSSDIDKGNQLEIDERGGTGAGNKIYKRDKSIGMSIRCVRSL